MKHAALAFVALFATVVNATPIRAQSATPTPSASVTYTDPIAYVGTDAKVYVTQIGKGIGTAVSISQPVILSWSPDGQKLLARRGSTSDLYVSKSAPSLENIRTGSEDWMPGWSVDSQAMFVPENLDVPLDDDFRAEIHKITLSPATDEIVVGQCLNLHQELAGDGYSSIASNEYYSAEITRSFIAQTTTGFIATHSVVLGYSATGLSYVRPDCYGWQRDDVSQANLSPDRRQVIALHANKLVAVDLETGNLTPIKTQPGINQFGWSADSKTIFYSTQMNPQVLLTDSEADKALIRQMTGGDYAPSDFVRYTLQLWKMPATGGPSTLILTDYGFGIGRIAGSSDGKNIVFSEILSMRALIKAINTGGDQAAADPIPRIYSVPISGGQPQFIADGSRFVVGSGVFTAVPFPTDYSDN